MENMNELNVTNSKILLTQKCATQTHKKKQKKIRKNKSIFLQIRMAYVS